MFSAPLIFPAKLVEGVHSEDGAHRHGLALGRRRRMRQREGVEAECYRGDGRRVERQGRLIGKHVARHPGEHERNEQAGHNPADGAEHANEGELRLLVLNVVEGQ